MTVSDIHRVQEARRRLEQAGGDQSRADPAVRILEFASPRPAEPSLALHTGFSVLSALSPQGISEVIATVGALYANTPNVGLGGAIVVDGQVHPMHDRSIPAVREIHTLADAELDVSWANLDELRELVEAVDSALLLTAAELRGADVTRRELIAKAIDVPEVIDLRQSPGERTEILETLAALDGIQPDQVVIDELEHVLDQVNTAGGLDRLQAVVDSLSATIDALPPGADEERDGLEEALDHAVEAQNRQIRERTTVAFELVDVLARIDITADVSDAVEKATRVVSEQGELIAIRHRLETRLSSPVARPKPLANSPELEAIARKTVDIQRRQHTQRHLLGAARVVLATAEGDDVASSHSIGPIGEQGRPMPILLVEPLRHIPPEYGAAVLSILLRVSEVHQVLCVSEEPEVQAWADDIGGRVGRCEAAGWFSGVAR